MGLRDRLKKIKNRSGSSTPSNGTSTPKIEYYKPGEEPKLKYRGKIDKEHTDKLHAFSFSDAWSRRKSAHSDHHGTMSPGGTYMAQSRATSFVASLRRKSVASHSGSETDAILDRDARRKSLAAQPETPTVKENEVDDTNIANTGASRPQTATGKPPDAIHPSGNSTNLNANDTSLEKTETKASTLMEPFSTEELQKALSRATIKPHATAIPQGEEIAAH